MPAERHDQMGPSDAVTPQELERERIVTYLDWAESGPRWCLPVYAVAVGAWIASYDLGRLWGTAAAIVFAGVMGVLIRAATADSGVSTPRFRGMPAALRWTFLPMVVVVVAAVGAWLLMRASTGAPSYLLLGVVTGPALAASAAVHAVWFRREARHLVVDLGTPR